MAKTDHKKELKEFYNPSSQKVMLIEVPKINFIMLDGQGDPGKGDFQESEGALFHIARTIQIIKKRTADIDYCVMPLEVLWWADELSVFDPIIGDKNKWQWTLMIMQPDFVTDSDFENAKNMVAEKNKDNHLIGKVRFNSFQEGHAAQIMHIGQFSEAGPFVQRLFEEIGKTNGKLSGKYHEIYLSDFNRVKPAKTKTILRQPYIPWYLIRIPNQDFINIPAEYPPACWRDESGSP